MADSRDRNPLGLSDETILTHAGRHPDQQLGFVNTPVTRGSTVLFDSLEAFDANALPFGYGRPDNPNSRSVDDVITVLEKAEGTVSAPSGLGAISIALMSCLSAGDELLVTDSAYGPTRRFCTTILERFGVVTRFYDPRIGGDIADLITPKTRAIYMESPGSLTFEVQDVSAIIQAARNANPDIVTLMDNTWATPLFFTPLELGVDLVVHAGTKMFVGHSDAMYGTVSANKRSWPPLQRTQKYSGVGAAPDDAFLAARGLRTLSIRMREHEKRALELARWLEAQPLVERVLHPALASHPDHDLFKRDFKGSGSLFGFVLPEAPRRAVAALVDDMQLFGIGASWGGYESLILPTDPTKTRTAVPWVENGNLIRVHIGFEGLVDLKSDLESGLARYSASLG